MATGAVTHPFGMMGCGGARSGGTAVALVPPQGDYRPGRMTGISLGSTDPRADHAELTGGGVDVDADRSASSCVTRTRTS